MSSSSTDFASITWKKSDGNDVPGLVIGEGGFDM